MALKSYYKENVVECGCDEAGRGCLAGPVFAAAVVLPFGYENDKIKDSKKISEKNRYLLRDEIENVALSYSVAQLNNIEVDKINIFKAAMKSMHMAVDGLSVKPELLLIDGNLFIKHSEIPHVCIVKGDDKFYSIAAASILAKTYRDDYMKNLHDEYPQYNWAKNKGYGTKEHCLAIEEHGITKYHRKSFKIADKQLAIDFNELP